MKNYYELLGLPPDASADEVKKSFRREISRYHPDKVQHLGKEFQELAAIRASELTEAYRILADPAQRVEYDNLRKIAAPGEAPYEAPRPAAASEAPPGAAAASHGSETQTAGPAPRASTVADAAPRAEPESAATEPPSFREHRRGRDELVRKAALGRFRQVVGSAFDDVLDVAVSGFQVSFVIRPRRGLFKKSEAPTRVLARFVTRLDGAAVQETWPLALRVAGAASEELAVFLLSTDIAPSNELARVIGEQRRRQPRVGANMVLVPVDVRDWDALVPSDAPPSVRVILERLKSAA